MENGQSSPFNPPTRDNLQSAYPAPTRGFAAAPIAPAPVPMPPVAIEPTAPQPNLALSIPTDDRPVPVVKVLSVRGIEYLFMSFCLWLGAGALITLLLALLYSEPVESQVSALALLIVSLPIFTWLFIRLKKAEKANPSLRLDASKRRLSQTTQILAFLTCFINLTVYVYQLLSMAGGSEVDLVKTSLSMLIILAVAGGVLVYYWFDEHKLVK